MNINRILLLIIFIISLIINCDAGLDSWRIETENIPIPNINTISYISEDIRLCISNENYTKYYPITYQFASEHDWSPDKLWICYHRQFVIYKIKYDGTEKTQLSPFGMVCELPRFSPDGNHIVFIVKRPNQNPNLFLTDIYIMNKYGTGIKQITENSMFSTEHEFTFTWPDWLKDGKHIIFTYINIEENYPRQRIAILNIENNNLTKVTFSDSLDAIMSRPSPTRDEFLFVGKISSESTGADIFRANMDGTNIIKLTNNNLSIFPDWSVNGEMFLYNFMENNASTIRSMSRDGTNDHRLIIGNHEYGMGPNW